MRQGEDGGAWGIGLDVVGDIGAAHAAVDVGPAHVDSQDCGPDKVSRGGDSEAARILGH
ncbi:hypothetical protein D3C73_1139060 [compost metagenome]